MRISDTMPFAHELIGPLHAQSFRRAGAVAAENEVTIGGDWSLSREDDQPLTCTAQEHLVGFLRSSLNVELGLATGNRLRLVVDPTLGGKETHRLRASQTEIEVAGADPVGVLQGVFYLESLMRERGGPFVPLGERVRRPLFAHRIHRSALSPFYVDELTGYDGPPLDARWFSPGMAYPAYQEEDAGPDVFYHDNLLLRLAEHGFNGIWVRGAFRKFAKVSAFPEFGDTADAILGELRRLCQRAARCGIEVFLYLNEPMGMSADDPFWQAHPEVRGSSSRFKPMVHLCTSTPQVKEYLRESTRYVFSQVPELAGVVLITASEFPSHCYCHAHRPDDEAEQQKLIAEGTLCPRCLPRTPQEIIGEIVTLICDGAKSVKPAAEVISWNWSWGAYEPDPQRGVLERLPADAIVMGDFERGQPTEACGFAYTNDEYSLKVVGPSPRFTGVADFQRERHMPVYARIQLGTTHENPDIPYLPTPQKIAEKYHALRDSGVTGTMTCWNFGNMLSLATEIAGEFTWDPQPEVGEGLRRLAVCNFGPAAADDVVAGWELLSRAHDAFPSSIPVMYNGPLSRGPAFLFVFDRINHKFPNSWLLDAETEGDLLDWATPFGPEKVAECFRSEGEKGAAAITLLERALTITEGADRERLAREVGVAKFHLIQTTSAANVVEFLLARNAMYDAPDPKQKRAHLDRMEALCRAELENAAAALLLLDADPRLGWHGEAYGYMIDRKLVEEKLAGLEVILGERIPAERLRV